MQIIFLKKQFLCLQKPILVVPLHRFFKEVLESVAQQVEHIPFKDGVLGSSPSWFTKANNGILKPNGLGIFCYIIAQYSIKLPYTTKRRRQAAFLCVITKDKDSNQWDVVVIASFPHIVGPDAGLDFANVRFAQEEHAEPRLADAAAN